MLQGVDTALFERGVEELFRRYPDSSWTVVGEGGRAGKQEPFDRCVIIGLPSTSGRSQFLAWRLAVPQVTFLDPNRWTELTKRRRQLFWFLVKKTASEILFAALGAVAAAGLVFLVILNLLAALLGSLIVEGWVWRSRRNA